jgi:hypothetical protein
MRFARLLSLFKLIWPATDSCMNRMYYLNCIVGTLIPKICPNGNKTTQNLPDPTKVSKQEKPLRSKNLSLRSRAKESSGHLTAFALKIPRSGSHTSSIPVRTPFSNLFFHLPNLPFHALWVLGAGPVEDEIIPVQDFVHARFGRSDK